MITWMQKHKKWLIVTIWISTIAFVGAGFVGWGSYDYGKSKSTIAIVGNKEIPLNALQDEYNALYTQAKNILGNNFNQEMAKQFRLEETAFNNLIQKYYLLNYADEIGLITTDKEVAKELLKIKAFYKDGKFDKNRYISVLKQNRRTVAQFEAQLKQDILIAKVQNLFNLPLAKNEIKNISQLLFSQDRVSIEIIDISNIKITPTNEQLKQYWDKNKNNYLSPAGLKIAFIKIANIDGKTKKQMKKVALKSYLDLKKGDKKFTNEKTIYDDNNFLTEENYEKVSKATPNGVLKPIYKNNNYYVIKLIQKIEPQPLPFEQVKDLVKTDFIKTKKIEILKDKTQQAMKNFKGKDIGYINRTKVPQIDNLTQIETEVLLKDLFATTKQLNSITLGLKAVVYKITDSKFDQYDPTKDSAVIAAVQKIKNGSLQNNLLKQLALKYEVISFMDKK